MRSSGLRNEKVDASSEPAITPFCPMDFSLIDIDASSMKIFNIPGSENSRRLAIKVMELIVSFFCFAITPAAQVKRVPPIQNPSVFIFLTFVTSRTVSIALMTPFSHNHPR